MSTEFSDKIKIPKTLMNKGFSRSASWCERRDLNPYESPHTPLKRARLPIPPLSQLPKYIITYNSFCQVIFLKKSACKSPFFFALRSGGKMISGLGFGAKKAGAASTLFQKERPKHKMVLIFFKIIL